MPEDLADFAPRSPTRSRASCIARRARSPRGEAARRRRSRCCCSRSRRSRWRAAGSARSRTSSRPSASSPTPAPTPTLDALREALADLLEGDRRLRRGLRPATARPELVTSRLSDDLADVAARPRARPAPLPRRPRSPRRCGGGSSPTCRTGARSALRALRALHVGRRARPARRRRRGRHRRRGGRPPARLSRPVRCADQRPCRSRLRAALGSALFLVVAPGVMALLIPWWLTGWEVQGGGTGWWPCSARSAWSCSCSPAGCVLLQAFVRFVDRGRRYTVAGGADRARLVRGRRLPLRPQPDVPRGARR